MAGSYGHVVTRDGSLSSNARVASMLENGGDVFEAVEEMYGMIWYLARMLGEEMRYSGETSDLVGEAQSRYKEGLSISPTKRYR